MPIFKLRPARTVSTNYLKSCAPAVPGCVEPPSGSLGQTAGPQNSGGRVSAQYGWAIDALEYNGMRSREENDRVLQLAESVNKPVIGGGDSHLLLASSVLSVSQAESYADFAAEVKEGRAVPLIAPMYFAPLNWKIILRVLYFIAHYRQIGYFRGQAVRDLLAERTVLLDPLGFVFRGFLSLTSTMGLLR